jgi:YD repeat-containing protein
VTHTTLSIYNSYGQLPDRWSPDRCERLTTYTYYPILDHVTIGHSIPSPCPEQTTTYSNYDANGNVGSITDPNGVITTLTYDERNRLRTVTNTSVTPNTTTQYFYDIRGNLSSVILPEGNRIDYTYSLADKVVEIKDNMNNRIVYGDDVEGNRNRERSTTLQIP